MPVPPDTIFLNFSDTGHGHRSATDAVAAALDELIRQEATDQFKIIKEAIIERSHPINRTFVNLYNYLLRHNQPLMKYYYSFIHLTKPNDNKLAYGLVADFLRTTLLDVKPSVVVSLHPMSNHFLAQAMQDVGLKGDVKLVTIVTDPNADLWRGWACHEADIIIAPNEIVAEKLSAWGIGPNQIRVVGMPVHPDFTRPPSVSRHEYLSGMGLDPQLPTACINAGWAGGGNNMLKVYQAVQTIQRDIQIIFLCGHNKQLYEDMQSLSAQSRIPTVIMPFLDSMSDLMASVDTMVTKAGGLTTYECLARRLPMILDVITPPMPQEQGTVTMLVEQKQARPLYTAGSIAELLQTLEVSPFHNRPAPPSKYCLNRSDAALEIAQIILDRAYSNSAINRISYPFEKQFHQK